MNQQPLISIVVAVYNGEKFIRKCVDSLLAQTYSNLEIILVNDGSVDASAQICDQCAQQDKRIQVIHQKNSKISATRNAGIKKAQGEYISFLDQDDWVDPAFIETLWQTAHKYQAPISVVGRKIIFPTKTVEQYILPRTESEKLISTPQPSFSASQALELVFSPLKAFVTSKLFKKSLFEFEMFPVGLGYEDMWILSRFYQHVNKVAVSNSLLYYYNCCNENSLSLGKFNDYMLDYFKVTDEFIAQVKQEKNTDMLRKLQQRRLSHILGIFRRMMLADFNEKNVISPLQRELRRNIWLLLRHPRPLISTAFGCCCAVNFTLAKKITTKLLRPS